MADILLKMLAPTVYTFHVKNIQQYQISLQQPVTPTPLPEQPYTQAILIKMEGNVMTIILSWLLQDLQNGASAVDELTGASAITTADQQKNFLLNTFECNSIKDEFGFEEAGASPPFNQVGLFTKLDIVQTEEDL